MGASMQALLIGNNKTHSPYIGFFKLEQEALGKYTDQYTVRRIDNDYCVCANDGDSMLSILCARIAVREGAWNRRGHHR